MPLEAAPPGHACWCGAPAAVADRPSGSAAFTPEGFHHLTLWYCADHAFARSIREPLRTLLADKRPTRIILAAEPRQAGADVAASHL